MVKIISEFIFKCCLSVLLCYIFGGPLNSMRNDFDIGDPNHPIVPPVPAPGGPPPPPPPPSSNNGFWAILGHLALSLAAGFAIGIVCAALGIDPDFRKVIAKELEKSNSAKNTETTNSADEKTNSSDDD